MAHSALSVSSLPRLADFSGGLRGINNRGHDSARGRRVLRRSHMSGFLNSRKYNARLSIGQSAAETRGGTLSVWADELNNQLCLSGAESWTE
jgi:hypothetical protein